MPDPNHSFQDTLYKMKEKIEVSAGNYDPRDIQVNLRPEGTSSK